MSLRARLRPRVFGLFMTCLVALGGFVHVMHRSRAPRAVAPPPRRALDQTWPYGGFLVRLSHSGARTLADERALLGLQTQFDISGVVSSELLIGASLQPLETHCVVPMVLSQAGVVEPRRALEITATDGTRWRLEVAVFSGDRDVTPDLGSELGVFARLRVDTVTFGVTPFSAVRLDDADGLVLALDFRLADDGAGSDLPVRAGPVLSRTTDSCGTYATTLLLFSSEPRGVLRPGGSTILTIGDLEYRAWNLNASLLTEPGGCTDQVSNVAWAVQRLPYPI